MYSEGSLHESDFTCPYDSKDEAVNSECETQTESAPVTLEQSTLTHDLTVNFELAVDCEDQEPAFQTVAVPDELVFESTFPVTDYMTYGFQEPGPDLHLPPSENLSILRTWKLTGLNLTLNIELWQWFRVEFMFMIESLVHL